MVIARPTSVAGEMCPYPVNEKREVNGKLDVFDADQVCVVGTVYVYMRVCGAFYFFFNLFIRFIHFFSRQKSHR